MISGLTVINAFKVYFCKSVVHFHFLHAPVQFSQHHLSKGLFLISVYFYLLCQDIN